MQLGLDFDVPPPKARRTAALESFHPRDESPAEALAGEAKAKRQEDAILQWFRDRPVGTWAPSDLEAWFMSWPVTSIRRALTNLTGRGLLVKHREDRRPGPRGARECRWGLA